MTMPPRTSYLRSCAGCAAHILVDHLGGPQLAYCARCQPARPPFAEWAASLTCNSTVFLQPYAAWRGLSHSTYLVLDRDGDTLTVQMIGIPASRMQVDVAQCADHDVTPRRDWGAAD